jgi:hypothetical protein
VCFLFFPVFLLSLRITGVGNFEFLWGGDEEVGWGGGDGELCGNELNQTDVWHGWDRRDASGVVTGKVMRERDLLWSSVIFYSTGNMKCVENLEISKSAVIQIMSRVRDDGL